MTEKKYQVFISSTYEDLKDERKAVVEAILGTGDFPIGMEVFPAADEEQFEFIKSIIDECDYYILIIAGKYGTLAKDGLSYTQKEFEYATEKGIPVLVMLHGDRGSIPRDKSEKDAAKHKKLESFISRAEDGRIRKTWTTTDGLKLVVREALDYAKRTKLRVGWVRADRVADVFVLQENRQLRKENESLKKSLGEVESELVFPDLPKIDDRTNLTFVYESDGSSKLKISASWIDIFPLFEESLIYTVNDWNDEYYYNIDHKESRKSFSRELLASIQGYAVPNVYVRESDYSRFFSMYVEKKLINADNRAPPVTDRGSRLGRRVRISGVISEAKFFAVLEGKLPIEDPNEIPF